jgi:hypothetical protein
MGSALDGIPGDVGANQNFQASAEDMFGSDDTLGLVFFQHSAFLFEIRRRLGIDM